MVPDELQVLVGLEEVGRSRDVLAKKDLAPLRRYFEAVARHGASTSRRAKMVLVGTGQAGKRGMCARNSEWSERASASLSHDGAGAKAGGPGCFCFARAVGTQYI